MLISLSVADPDLMLFIASAFPTLQFHFISVFLLPTMHEPRRITLILFDDLFSRNLKLLRR